MKKIFFTLVCALLMMGNASAQTAKQVLDKTAASISSKSGIKANFSISGNKYGNVSGTIAVKGRKFQATTPMAVMWFDGKTQWTYMKKNDEVNVANPTEAQLQAINPYNFINMYKNGFTYSMTNSGGNYVVHLDATNQGRSVQEMYITVSKSSYTPSQVKMRQGKNWTTINISGLQRKSLSDGMFRFNAKDYPKAEVIDLR